MLDANERVAIVHSNLNDMKSLKDIASQYHISAGLAGRLVRQYR